MLNTAAREGKVLDILDHATKPKSRAEQLAEIELVEGRTPRYHKRVIYRRAGAGHRNRCLTMIQSEK
jgi:hypothetical protein